MKKLTTILLFAYMHIFCAYSQIEEDKQAHFAAGAFIGFVANIETYEMIKDTQLKPWQSKLIALGSGIVLGSLAGHAKEKYDKIYNKKDFKATMWGALAGSLTVRLILWNSIPESHVPIEEIWLLENEFVNNE